MSTPWTPATITVQVANDAQTQITYDVTTNGGPFAVHPQLNSDVISREWSVTHIGTGLRVPATFPDEESAQGYAEAMCTLPVDWNIGEMLLGVEMKPHFEKIRRLVKKHGGTIWKTRKEKNYGMAKVVQP